ncbi:hypothetical protein DPMN_099621 [Dreissena polymorpha]|uniref:Uncharacterized protein n=1 Tax=Dreissena polymorpha TaxID=45954 RepID=A0A9D4R6Q2_DREPO|nr:hypothetical protein DPMN_099621 [Dreissena polymorpha]
MHSILQATDRVTQRSSRTVSMFSRMPTRSYVNWQKSASLGCWSLANCGSSTGTWPTRKAGSERRSSSCRPLTLAMTSPAYISSSTNKRQGV